MITSNELNFFNAYSLLQTHSIYIYNIQGLQYLLPSNELKFF